MKTLNTFFPDVKNTHRGLQYNVIGSVIGYNTKVEVECLTCKTRTNSTPLSIFAGQIPCKCGKGYYRTDERRFERLVEVTSETNLLIDYTALIPIKNVKARIDLTCKTCGYKWDASYLSVVRQTTGCSRCSNVTRYTDEEYIDKINALEKVSFLSKTTEKIGGSTNVLVECVLCNHPFSASVGNLLQDRGCPRCANYGYNTKKPGHLYILSLKNCDEIVGYKFGISNSPSNRLKHLARQSNLNVKPIFIFNFTEGSEALDLENKIKKRFGNFLSREVLQEGFTETISPKEIKDLLQYIQNEVSVMEV